VPAQAIMYERAGLQDLRRRRQDAEVQPGRSDALEVRRVAKEGEHGRDWLGQSQLRFVCVDFQSPAPQIYFLPPCSSTCSLSAARFVRTVGGPAFLPGQTIVTRSTLSALPRPNVNGSSLWLR